MAGSQKESADGVLVGAENANEIGTVAAGSASYGEVCGRENGPLAGESGSDEEGEYASATGSESYVRCRGRAIFASGEAGNEVGVIGTLSGAGAVLLVSGERFSQVSPQTCGGVRNTYPASVAPSTVSCSVPAAIV